MVSKSSTSEPAIRLGGVTQDLFLGGRITLLQPREGYRAAIDPVLLAAAVDLHPGQSVLDLGCGTALILLCLARRVPNIEAFGLELQSRYVELACHNMALNDVEAQIFQGSVDHLPTTLRRRRFNHVVINPPYQQFKQGTRPKTTSKQLASVESLPLSAWAHSASKRLAPEGQLTMILPPARLQDFLTSLPPSLGGIQIKPIRPRSHQNAHRILIRAKKNRHEALRLTKDIILHPTSETTKYTQEAEAVLRHGAAINF